MSDYPPDFQTWPLDRRNEFFAAEYRDILANRKTQTVPSAPLPLTPPMPAARPYPVAALGALLSGAAESIAGKCQCAPALAAQGVLAVASLAAQRLADVRLPYGQTRPLSLYLVTIAASGDRKSTADIEALIPVRKHESNLKRDYEIEHQNWRISQAAWAAQHRKIENDKGLERLAREADLAALGRAPVEPIQPLLTAPEPTVEALAKHWHALPGALGLFSAEGGQMTGGHGFGPDHRLKTAAALSTLWDGSGIRRLRAGDGITDLPDRRLALHLMVQPDAAAAFLSEQILRDQGLLSRLLVAAPETLAGSRTWREPSDGLDVAMRHYVAVILNLLERPAPSANAAGNELTPRALDLSAAAKGAWIVFHDRIEAAMAPDGGLETMRDVAGKAAENAARIAGVLTIANNPDASTIGAEAVAAGCELMTWYIAEALRLSSQHRLPVALRNAIKLLEWLRVRNVAEIALRDVMRNGPNPVRGKAEAEAALAKLEEHERGNDVNVCLSVAPETAARGGKARVSLPTGRTFDVAIAAGVSDGVKLRLHGQGQPSRNGGEPGDALITLKLKLPLQSNSSSATAAENASPAKIAPSIQPPTAAHSAKAIEETSQLKPRSDELPPGYLLPYGDRLKEMFRMGVALAQAQAKEQAARRKPECKPASDKLQPDLPACEPGKQMELAFSPGELPENRAELNFRQRKQPKPKSRFSEKSTQIELVLDSTAQPEVTPEIAPQPSDQTEIKPRSVKLQPEFTLATGERLKEMARIGLALAQASQNSPSDSGQGAVSDGARRTTTMENVSSAKSAPATQPPTPSRRAPQRIVPPEQWRRVAANLRELAGKAETPEAKAELLRHSRNFETLAKIHAARQARADQAKLKQPD